MSEEIMSVVWIAIMLITVILLGRILIVYNTNIIDFLNKHETPFLLSLAVVSAVTFLYLCLAVYMGFVR